MEMKNILIFILFIFSINCKASSEGLFIGAGMINNNILSTSQKDGSTNLIGQTFYPITLKYSKKITGDWSINPFFGLTHFTTALVPSETPEKGAKKNLILFGIPASMTFSGSWEFNAGLVMNYYQISGKGGSATLNNGSSTKDFPLPSKSKNATNIDLQLGISKSIDKFKLNLNSLWGAPLSSTRRTLNFLITVDYLI